MVVTDSRAHETPTTASPIGGVSLAERDDQPSQGEILVAAALLLDGITLRLEDLFNLRENGFEVEQASASGRISKTSVMPAAVIEAATPVPNDSAVEADHAVELDADVASPPRPLWL